MFKKILLIIIGIILLLLISFAIIHEASLAQTPSTLTTSPILTTCDIDGLNKYLSLTKDLNDTVVSGGDGFNDLKNSLTESDGYGKDIKIRIAFEKARAKYNDTIKCIFDVATIKILGSATGVGDNISKNSLPDISSALTDLNDTKKACGVATKLPDIINGASGPSVLVQPILDAYNNYVAFINYLIDQFKNVSITSTGSSLALGDYGDKFLKMQLIMNNETQNAILALNAAFQSLKEMRTSFVMHIRFECMLQNLQLYQKMLKNIRSIVSSLPSVIENASMHK